MLSIKHVFTATLLSSLVAKAAVWAPDIDRVPDTSWASGYSVVWNTAGVAGGIPTNRTQSGSTITSTGDTTNRTTTIQNALNAASTGTYVLLGPGSFTITQLSVPNGVTLRGSGMTSTVLAASSSNAVLLSGGDPQWTASGYETYTTPVVSGLTKGSTQVVVDDGSEIVKNMAIFTFAPEAETPVTDLNITNEVRKMVVRVTNVSGNTIDFLPALPFAPSGAALKTSYEDARVDAGLEDLTVSGTASGTMVTGVYLSLAYNSWAARVKVVGHTNYGIVNGSSVRCTISQCWVGEQLTAQSNRAGILYGYASHCLTEHTIVESNPPGMEVNSGTVCSVWAYPFMPESQIDGMLINHGAWNSFNLYEGGWVTQFKSDGYFGGESDQTIFRNRILGTADGGVSASSSVALNRTSRRATVVGNVNQVVGVPGMTNNGFNFGYPNIGNTNFDGYAKASSVLSVSSLTRSSTTATAVTSTAHGLVTGDGVWMRGADQSAYNGYFTTTVTDSTTFTFTVSGSPATPATGTIVAGREWLDWDWSNSRPWRFPGVLTTRTDEYNGVITLDSSALAAQFTLYLAKRASGSDSLKASYGGASGATIEVGGKLIRAISLTGLDVTITSDGTGSVLPTASSAIIMYPGTSGFQERDLDVAATTELKGNYSVYDDGIPVDQSLGGDTLPDSLFLASKPTIFGSLSWPPYDPFAPTDNSSERIPAGYFFANGVWPSAVTGNATVTGTTTVTGTLTLP